MNSAAVRAIIAYGERYREKFLRSVWTEDQLREDWREAVKFFFDKAFYQGRSDVMSGKVHEAALNTLEPKLSAWQRLPKDWDREELRKSLQAKIGKGKVGRGRDVEMVISSLEYVSKLPRSNIVAHSVQRIEAGEIGRHFDELQKAKNEAGIIQVGPKIASFYLRDVVSLFELEDKVSADFQFTLQPIDTWVRKVAFCTGMVPEKASDRQIGQAIIDLCSKENCSPLQFNQGAWYAGARAFDLLMENLAAS